MGVMVAGFLLAVTPPTTLLPSSPVPSLAARSFASQPFPRLANNSFSIVPKSTYVLKERFELIAKASSEEVSSSLDSSVPPPVVESEKENVSVENLPLESKAQMLLEAKLRMRLAKKIRLRRKRLVRKRHLRKKGRWPPSKMKKNKNV